MVSLAREAVARFIIDKSVDRLVAHNPSTAETTLPCSVPLHFCSHISCPACNHPAPRAQRRNKKAFMPESDAALGKVAKYFFERHSHWSSDVFTQIDSANISSNTRRIKKPASTETGFFILRESYKAQLLQLDRFLRLLSSTTFFIFVLLHAGIVLSLRYRTVQIF